MHLSSHNGRSFKTKASQYESDEKNLNLFQIPFVLYKLEFSTVSASINLSLSTCVCEGESLLLHMINKLISCF